LLVGIAPKQKCKINAIILLDTVDTFGLTSLPQCLITYYKQ